MGTVVGVAVLGAAEGVALGLALGCAVGWADGVPDGVKVGPAVGVPVGSVVLGLWLGVADGRAVGVSVVGLIVGEAVGTADGLAVGTADGASLCPATSGEKKHRPTSSHSGRLTSNPPLTLIVRCTLQAPPAPSRPECRCRAGIGLDEARSTQRGWTARASAVAPHPSRTPAVVMKLRVVCGRTHPLMAHPRSPAQRSTVSRGRRKAGASLPHEYSRTPSPSPDLQRPKGRLARKD